MLGYLLIGAPAGVVLPADFFPLQVVAAYASYFLSEGYVATLLYQLVPLFLLMIPQQLARKKRAYGGRLFANSYTPADLDQHPADRLALKLLGSEALFQMLREELRLFLRLLRAAQRSFWAAPHEEEWRQIHNAACFVLLRLAQISAALRNKGKHLLGEEYVRWQASVVWQELFGKAPKTKEEKEWMEPPKDVPESEQQVVMYHLRHERRLGRPIAAPLVARFEAWAAQRGE